jgi:adenine deaminase
MAQNISSLAYRRNNLIALKLEGIGLMSKQELAQLDKQIAKMNAEIEKRMKEREGKKE